MSSSVSMKKRLFLLRHEMAVRSNEKDIERSLSSKGRNDAIALGKFLKDNNYMPDIILCSPAIRTRETLKNLEQNIKLNNISFPNILYDGGAGDYLYEIQKIKNAYKNVLVIAHNPSIYELVILLAAQGKDSVINKLSRGYPTGTLSIIDCVCDKWEDIQPVENELFNIVSPVDYNAPDRPTRWM